jgi:hypothetical protein
MRSGTSCEPRQVTARNPDRETDGHAVSVLARLSGRTMPPWARAAVDVLGEQDRTPSGLWRYAYPITVVTVPRQSAKTTTALDVALGRGMLHRDYRAAYAAQTGHVTTERMADRFTELGASLLAPRLRIRRSAGTERVTYLPHGSYVKAFPPIDGALRSSALDLVIVDEGQEHADDPLGRALDHTVMPTFTTRPRRQFLILGTAPALPGSYLERYAALARAGAPGVALVDYGATPDEDPGDPATWRRRHPGLAAGLTDEAFLTDQYRLDPDGFTREHLNVWPRGNPGAVIPADAWDRVQVPTPRPTGVPLRWSLEVARGSTSAAIAAAWLDADGVVRAAVVQAGEGTAWLDAALPDLVRKYAARFVWDGISPAHGIAQRLRVPGRALDFTDVAAGCSWFLEAVCATPPRVTVTPDEDLDRAAASAVKRTVGDTGRWAWGRKGSALPVTPLVAVTFAAYAAVAPDPEPFML